MKKLRQWIINKYRQFKYKLGVVVYTTSGGMIQIVGKGPGIYLGTIIDYHGNELVYVCPDMFLYYNAQGELFHPPSLANTENYGRLTLKTFAVLD